MSDIEKIQGITPNLTKENVDKLLTLFPRRGHRNHGSRDR